MDKTYTFSVEPWGYDVSVVADNEKAAHKLAWDTLADDHKDNCECLDLIDATMAAMPSPEPVLHVVGVAA